MEHSFGGNWTEKKLLCLKKYLVAYATIMNKQIFDFFYVDAFAGTGYCNPQCSNNNEDSLFEFDEANEVKEYLEGSARIALQIKPEFSQYLFIEKCRNHFVELERLKNEFSGISEKIQLVNDEANSFIRKFCEQTSWKRSRAVMFLDPYGMQVDWTTIQAIARTKAIDLWYLFPLGTGVNRLLKKSKKDIPESWRNKLTQTLGTAEWENDFYSEVSQMTFFGEEKSTVKDIDFEGLRSFIIKRLKTEFAGVVEQPLFLRNSKNNPLYLLCFAAGNPKGAPTAIKIAGQILNG